jgi:hypothetical protein
MTKLHCPNKSIYYFFKINTKISTNFRQSKLISYLIQTNFGFIVCYDIDNVHIEVNIRDGSRISS